MSHSHQEPTKRQPLNLHASNNDYSTSLILGALAPEHRDSLLHLGQERSYRKGQTLFSRGEDGDWILLIQQGEIEISVVSLNGRKSILNLMGKNDVLGEIALLDRRERSADAIARTDVKGIVLQRATVIDFLEKNTDACFSLIETLCARVRNASSMFETMALTSAGARLARCLLRLSEKWGVPADDGAVRIDHTISQSDLGEFSGLARENVNRYIKTWAGDGLLSFNKGEITLFDNERLREIAEM
jgi:CRP-like cAMP-binding protein